MTTGISESLQAGATQRIAAARQSGQQAAEAVELRAVELGAAAADGLRFLAGIFENHVPKFEPSRLVITDAELPALFSAISFQAFHRSSPLTASVTVSTCEWDSDKSSMVGKGDWNRSHSKSDSNLGCLLDASVSASKILTVLMGKGSPLTIYRVKPYNVEDKEPLYLVHTDHPATVENKSDPRNDDRWSRDTVTSKPPTVTNVLFNEQKLLEFLESDEMVAAATDRRRITFPES